MLDAGTGGCLYSFSIAGYSEESDVGSSVLLVHCTRVGIFRTENSVQYAGCPNMPGHSLWLQADDLRHLVPFRHSQMEIIRVVRAVPHVDLQTYSLIGQLRNIVLLAQMAE